MKVYKYEPKLLPLKQYFFELISILCEMNATFAFALYDKNFLV